jgi:putative lipoprotein
MRFHEAIVSVAIALLISTPAVAAQINLPGQVTYRERITLPELATLELQLIDQTLPGAPPRVDVRAAIGSGEVPLSFTLAFEDTIVLPDHSYALIAAISDDSGLLFRNFEPYPVNPLAPAEPVVIVTNLVAQTEASSSMSSEQQDPAPPAILDQTWTAATISGAPVLPRTTLTLAIGSDMRAGGSGGCNSWFAQAKLDGDMLRLGSITSTLKGCSQSINLQEQAFKDALADTATWRIEGDDLTLYGADGKSLIVFHR